MLTGTLKPLARLPLAWLHRAGAALGWLVYSVPHLGYHVFNLDHYDDADQVGLVVTLVATPIVALVVLLLNLRERAAPSVAP